MCINWPPTISYIEMRGQQNTKKKIRLLKFIYVYNSKARRCHFVFLYYLNNVIYINANFC